MIEIKHEGGHFCNLCGDTNNETINIYFRCGTKDYTAPGGLMVQLCTNCQENLIGALQTAAKNPDKNIVYLSVEESK